MEYKYDGIVPGGRADLIVLSATNGPEAVVERPPRKLVVKSGRIVADWRHGTALTLPPVALTGSQWTV
jgi:cytosine/creatinine deaminase